VALGLIPRPFIDELLSRTDVVEFIDSYIPLKKQGTSHVACCPFHNEKSPSFNVTAKKQFYHCFGCGASGNAISFAMNYLHLSFPDAVENLATRLGMTVPHEGRSEQDKPALNLYQFLIQVCNFYQQELKSSHQAAIPYLKERQVSGEVARLYQLGYAPPGWQTLESQFKKNKEELIASGMIIVKDDGKTYDRYRQRIMFPIHDRHGRIIGFGGRAIEPGQKPKYLNSPETIVFQKSRELYGLHQVLQQQSAIQNIIIVEGYLDVIALAQHGVPNAVATLGTTTSAYHVQLLSKYTQQLIFCFDGDAAGRKAAWRALESSLPYLNSGLDASFIFLPEGEDPDSLIRKEGKEQFLNRLKEATPLNQFFIDTLTLDIDCTKLAGKSQLVNAAKPYILKMSDGPYKQLLMNELARLTRIEQHRMLQLVEEKTTDAAPVNQHQITRSPVRIAIAILLQHPEIYKNAEFKALDSQKQRVLKTIIEQIDKNPSISTAQLIELWRDTPIFEAINQLAAWDHQVPDSALLTELIEIVTFIAKQNRESMIQQLMKKTLKEGLSEAERHTLQNMLKQRHQNEPMENSNGIN
jgi:DNA primase